jgi:hypothetical protein
VYTLATDRFFSPDTVPSFFGVRPATGVVYTLQSFSGKLVGEDADRDYVFDVYVTDKGSPALRTKVLIYIHVDDVNTEGPEFTPAYYEKSIPENSGVGTSLFTLVATDEVC